MICSILCLMRMEVVLIIDLYLTNHNICFWKSIKEMKVYVRIYMRVTEKALKLRITAQKIVNTTVTTLTIKKLKALSEMEQTSNGEPKLLVEIITPI